jgi:ATP-dependent Clp protease protease subunit
VRGPIVHAVPPTGVDPVLDRLLDERIVYLGGELDAGAADRLVTQLLLLGAQDARRDISFYINSTGGSVTAAMAVHDAMQAVAPDIATWAVGLAGSMGQFLLTAGAAGKRHALPHARIQLVDGSATDVAVRAGIGGAIRREVAELTARRAGRPVETIITDSGQGRWFTATEAREYGLLDHVDAPAVSMASG